MTIFKYLANHQIVFERYNHPAVNTCEEAAAMIPNIPGVSTKSLFVRDKKGRRHFLIVIPDEKQVDLQKLAKQIESTRLSMGSPERLKRYLGIEPGAVSLLALMNDTEGEVETVLDESIAHSEVLQCHPLINTSTLVIERSGIDKFFSALGCKPRIMNVPAK